VGDKRVKMPTKPLELPKKSNIANAINQAAEFLQLGILEENQVKKEQYLQTALRWLETTNVTETVPPSIDNIRIRK